MTMRTVRQGHHYLTSGKKQLKKHGIVEKTGKGTRDWTKAEKDELLKTGKVKDYIGHHIKSVKGHPESAGNKNNIEFIKNSEHLQKHNGNFRNPTDGDFIDRTIQH